MLYKQFKRKSVIKTLCYKIFAILLKLLYAHVNLLFITSFYYTYVLCIIFYLLMWLKKSEWRHSFNFPNLHISKNKIVAYFNYNLVPSFIINVIIFTFKAINKKK